MRSSEFIEVDNVWEDLADTERDAEIMKRLAQRAIRAEMATNRSASAQAEYIRNLEARLKEAAMECLGLMGQFELDTIRIEELEEKLEKEEE